METNAGTSKENKNNKKVYFPDKKQQKQSSKRNVQHKKRPAPKTYQRENDVYITSKTHFKVNYSPIQKNNFFVKKDFPGSAKKVRESLKFRHQGHIFALFG